jgi:hypothetical protein
VYKKGSERLADYLGRNAVEAIKISHKDLAEKQKTDPLCMTVKTD